MPPSFELLLWIQETGAVGGFRETLSASPLLALGLLFGAGVLTSLNPCIYPMIPITVSVISGTSGGDAPRGRVVGLTVAYVLGMAGLYALLGLLAGLTGTLFGTVSANPWVMVGVGNLLLLFALAMLGVLPVPVPQRLLAWSAGQGGGSYGAVFLMGAGAGVVMAPCGAPAFAAVLTWVAATNAGALGFLYLFVFSLGMMALILATGLSSGFLSRLPRSGPWMVRVKQLSALVLFVMAQYYFVSAGYAM
jgi:cytochrome c-type biogenesis protein